MSSQPPRLANEAFMPAHTNLRVYRFANTASVGLHWHEFYELMLVTDGAGVHYLNGAALPLHAGMLCLLTPSDFHEVAPTQGQTLHFWNIIFTDALLRDSVSELLFNEISAYHIEIDSAQYAHLHADCERLWNETNHKHAGYEIIAQATLDRLLVGLWRNAVSYSSSNGMMVAPDPIRRALRFIQRHFREPLTLAEVARQARLSPAYFSDSFRRTTGHTFQMYVQHVRLQFARSLLVASDLPVSEICYAAGFNSLSHFVRAFKHQFGMPPSSYRQHANTENGAHSAEKYA